MWTSNSLWHYWWIATWLLLTSSLGNNGDACLLWYKEPIVLQALVKKNWIRNREWRWLFERWRKLFERNRKYGESEGQGTHVYRHLTHDLALFIAIQMLLRALLKSCCWSSWSFVVFLLCFALESFRASSLCKSLHASTITTSTKNTVCMHGIFIFMQRRTNVHLIKVYGSLYPLPQHTLCMLMKMEIIMDNP